METWQIGMGLAIGIVLIFKRAFWFVALTMGSLAAGFESLSNIMHLHIASALGYSFIMFFCWSFATTLASVSPSPKEKIVRKILPESTNPDHPDWSPH